MAMVQSDLVAGQKLRALLVGFKDRSGLTYEKLAELASCSRGTAENYIAKAGHRRSDGILASLLSVLGVTRDERDEAMRLHRLNRSCSTDPATVEWAASAAEADCTVWEMEHFTPAEATVHPAITRSQGLASALNVVSPPPSYVLRDHDALLHADITAAARGELAAMIALRGGPSTGKTRSLFEVVHALGPRWAVVRPRSASALRGLATSGLLHRRRCVLWLNELQAFLGPNGTGLSLDVLRDLFAVPGERDGGKRRQRQPLVVVATLWPEKLRDTTTAGEQVSDNRDLLVTSNQWVRWHDVPRDFSRRERDKARALAASDGRLRAALDNPDRIGFAQTLAGGHELLQHYLTVPNYMDQLVLDAAGDARRLGHTSPLSLPMLRAIATALWREERGQTSPPSGWFDTAIAHASQPLRSTRGVQALIPLDNADLHNAEAEEVTYELADYLEHYLRYDRRTHTVTDAVWDALRQHATRTVDIVNLARGAINRGHFQHGEALYRAAGTPEALLEFARWRAARPGQEQEAERIYREAIATGHPDALVAFARWLESHPGREDETEQVYREAIAAGVPAARIEFAWWLREQMDREDETELVYWDAVAAGDPSALLAFASWLELQPGREVETEHFYRGAVAAGLPDARTAFAVWLASQPGREGETEQVYRDAIVARDLMAQMAFISWMSEQPCREDDTERAYQDGIAAGYLGVLLAFAMWLAKQPGRDVEIEGVFRDAIATGHRHAFSSFVFWLGEQPGRDDDIESVYRDYIASGDPEAYTSFAGWLAKQPDRKEETERAYQDAIATGDPDAYTEFAEWLAEQPGREDDTERVYRDHIATGHPYALTAFAEWLGKQPRREEDRARLLRSGLIG
ncbi:hypothetical protein DL990_13620 [Amycolatopsis sp. WAC 01416]|uniref:helix-turn-helix domain-containing protein n=1 Tax=Amycolatopsis sp. WAC 01416 TaxID=2203196 RepID=UPI000F79DE52|nr:helix-turn-helix domain-containing protein [Amycolatopsis sp. WAC 01416]RSN34670.1 hypothetical protein DL990_13620 [Amycolatopsis sp. WAC 01416]